MRASAQDSMASIGLRFIDAFNRRDAEQLVALADPDIYFYPTELVGARRVYRGHDGLRRWVADLEASEIDHRVRLREVRALDESHFLVLSEVVMDGESVSPSAMLASLGDTGGILQAHAYLSDEQMLARLGLLGQEDAS
jgi:hypothetical protein